METLNFSPFCPEILSPLPLAPGLFRYPSPCREFTLYAMKSSGEKIIYNEKGPLLVVVTDGTVRINALRINALRISAAGDSNDSLVLKQGESAFIPAGSGPEFSGTFSLFAAGTGTSVQP
jgi:mannose-6-phosphate isomerase